MAVSSSRYPPPGRLVDVGGIKTAIQKTVSQGEAILKDIADSYGN